MKELVRTDCIVCGENIYHPSSENDDLVAVSSDKFKLYYHEPSKHFIIVDTMFRVKMATCCETKDLDKSITQFETLINLCDDV